MAGVPWDFQRWRCEGLKPVAVWGGCDLNAPGCEFNAAAFRSPAWYEYPAGAAECAYQNTFGRAATAAAGVYARARYGETPAPGAGLPLPPGPGPWTPELQQALMTGDADAVEAAYYGSGYDAFEQWRSGYSEAIDQAVTEGRYFPEGRIPGLVPDSSDLVLVAVLLVAGVAVLR